MSNVDASIAMPSTPIPDPSSGDRPRSLGRDAWEDLRKNPIVLICVGVIAPCSTCTTQSVIGISTPSDCARCNTTGAL